MHAKICEQACDFDIKAYLRSSLWNISYEDDEFEKVVIIFYVYTFNDSHNIWALR